MYICTYIYIIDIANMRKYYKLTTGALLHIRNTFLSSKSNFLSIREETQPLKHSIYIKVYINFLYKKI